MQFVSIETSYAVANSTMNTIRELYNDVCEIMLESQEAHDKAEELYTSILSERNISDTCPYFSLLKIARRNVLRNHLRMLTLRDEAQKIMQLCNHHIDVANRSFCSKDVEFYSDTLSFAKDEMEVVMETMKNVIHYLMSNFGVMERASAEIQ